MDNKKKTLAIVLGIFALVIVTTAASFAFFTYSRTGNTKATIISGDIEFSYIEGDSAELTNAFPVEDEIGAVDTTGEYDFQVKLNSSGTTTASYNVYLVDNNTSTNHFTNEQIKFALIKNDVYVANTSATEGVKLSTLDGFNEGTSKGEGIVLEDQEISSGETDNYKLRIWISDDVSYTNDYQSDGTMEGKYNSYTYSLKVKVTSGISNSITIGNINVSGKTITADLSDPNGLSAYAVTTSATTPEDNEWIEITNETAKSNVVRTATEKITNKSISHKVSGGARYYIHVKNKLDEVKFKSIDVKYSDTSGANEPVVRTGMIPVIYNGYNWVKADTSMGWHDYNDQQWANVVTVSSTNRQKYLDADYGTTIEMDDINTMWVWIPRYEYETITSTTATEIKVNFLSGTESNKTENYITHPAFTFGDKSLTGIWVAKFEASSDTSCTVASGDIDKGCDLTTLKVQVKPNVTSWRGIRVSTLDLNTRAMNDENNMYGFKESEVDTHAMKNLEWGSVAYLSQSKYGKYGNPNYTGANKEIYQNKSSDYITGMSNGTPSTDVTNTQVTYNVEGTGTGASTTGTIYGIYDMSGGAWDYVMGVIKDNKSDNPMSGQSDTYNSGFTGMIYNDNNYKDFAGRSWPSSKYYDLYEFGITYNDDTAYSRYKIGDATTETKGWYGDYDRFISVGYPWFLRGDDYDTEKTSGVFSFGRNAGSAYSNFTFRPVLVEN